MDANHFDRIVKSFIARQPRRRLLQRIGALSLGVAFAADLLEEGEAGRRKRRKANHHRNTRRRKTERRRNDQRQHRRKSNNGPRDFGPSCEEVLTKGGCNFDQVAKRWICFIGGIQANLSYAPLAGCDLRNAQLAQVFLSGADLSNAKLDGADLTLAQMDSAILRGATLAEAKLHDATLRGADFTGATLPSSFLNGIGTELHDTVFANAKLGGADFRGTAADPHRLQGVDFSGADLTHARFDQTQIGPFRDAGAIWDNAICPDGAHVDGTTIVNCCGHWWPLEDVTGDPVIVHGCP